MGREDYVAIAVRLLAIYLAVTTLGMVASGVGFVSQLQGQPVDGSLWIHGASTVLVAAITLGLWFFPLTVARALLPVMKEARSEETAGPGLLASLALSLMGVWLLARALVDGVYWGLLAMLAPRDGQGIPHFMPQDIANVGATAVEAVIGLLLVFGASGLKRLLFRLRYGDAVARSVD